MCVWGGGGGGLRVSSHLWLMGIVHVIPNLYHWEVLIVKW